MFICRVVCSELFVLILQVGRDIIQDLSTVPER